MLAGTANNTPTDCSVKVITAQVPASNLVPASARSGIDAPEASNNGEGALGMTKVYGSLILQGVSSCRMSKAEKLVEKMHANPRDWRMESIEAVAKRHGIEVRKTGGSHFVFSHSDCQLAVTIPSKRPIKPIYITQFLALLDDIGAK